VIQSKVENQPVNPGGRPLAIAESTVLIAPEYERERVRKLDSVRGVASLMVVVGHCYGETLSAFVQGLHLWPLQILWNGPDAVVMFFILSGYVLALQLSSRKVMTYTGFAVRRFFRIWPTFAVVTIAAAGLLSMVPSTIQLPTSLPAPSVSLYSIFANLLMIGESRAIDPPVWSLFIEMRVSLIFPLIFLLATRTNIFVSTAVGLAYSILASRLVHHDAALVVEFAETSRYVYLFVIGAALATPHNLILRRCSGPWVLSGILIAALGIIAYRFAPWPLPHKNYIPSIGVVLLFLICLRSTTAARFLERPELLFLGRISYGLYLVHFPILIFLLTTCPHFGQLAIGVAVISLSILAAWLLNLFVEQPMISIGRRLSTSAYTVRQNPAVMR
jgi:peptidoglycan/LPS O-acetylase OafA/YrhL